MKMKCEVMKLDKIMGASPNPKEMDIYYDLVPQLKELVVEMHELKTGQGMLDKNYPHDFIQIIGSVSSPATAPNQPPPTIQQIEEDDEDEVCIHN